MDVSFAHWDAWNIFMLYYRPTKETFSNRLEAKLKLGHHNFNKIVHEHPEDLIFINDKNALAIDEKKVFANTKLCY